MPAPKIVLYFTPDVKEIGRIPLTEIKFDTAKNRLRGRYEITLDHPDFIDGNCASHKSSVKSTASLTFKSVCFGEQTKYVFKVNDYFEIWDTRDEDDNWCYFRGVVNQISTSYQGGQRRVTLNLENAGGWMLGDNSIYYLRPLIIAQGQAPSKFFDEIKSKYGWLDKGINTQKFDDLGIEKIKTPSELMKNLIDQIGNVRVSLLREDFYDDEQCIKPMDFEVSKELNRNNVFVGDRLKEMEGSILEILKKFEGRPFSEMFIVEDLTASKIIWRNSRWRDSDENFCMGDFPGEPQNLVTLYTDPKLNFEGTLGIVKYPQENFKTEKQYGGIVSENTNKTNEDVVNAIYLYPAMMGVKDSVPAMVIAQSRYDELGAKNLLDLDSIIRHGYKPVKIELPFIPGYIDSGAFSKSIKDARSGTLDSNYNNIGEYLFEHTRYAASMYRNIQSAGNGASVSQNNLHVSIADDYRIIRAYNEANLLVNVTKIQWYFSPNEPRTVFEWDRGFEKPLEEIEAEPDPGFRIV